MTSPPSDEKPVITSVITSEFSQEERRLLLRLAHRAISAALGVQKLDLTPPTPHLAQPQGAFSTLHLHGKLRGCIGYVLPKHSLFQTVAEAAQAAAFEDPRFVPVTADEAPLLAIEISVLSPLQSIQPEEVIVGLHGLVVSKGSRRGLLLPQVPVEWGWDRETFLSQTCLKAGLSTDCWMHDAEIKAFTAEVFSDEDFPGSDSTACSIGP
jgi:AmmeMemoRadiSam system protein A